MGTVLVQDIHRDCFENNKIQGMQRGRQRQLPVLKEAFAPINSHHTVCMECATSYLKRCDVPEDALCYHCGVFISMCIENENRQSRILNWCIEQERYGRLKFLHHWNFSRNLIKKLSTLRATTDAVLSLQMEVILRLQQDPLSNITKGNISERRLLPILQELHPDTIRHLRINNNLQITVPFIARSVLQTHKSEKVVTAFSQEICGLLVREMASQQHNIEHWRVDRAIRILYRLTRRSNLYNTDEMTALCKKVVKKQQPVKSTAYVAACQKPPMIPDWLANYNFQPHYHQFPHYNQPLMRTFVAIIQGRMTLIKNKRRRLGVMKSAVLLHIQMMQILKRRFAPGGVGYREAKQHYYQTQRDVMWAKFLKN
jgi:hypothetical protein